MSKDKAADYFARHQTPSDECHITTDSRVFHTLGSAQGYASELKDNKVTSYTRAEFETTVVDDLEDKEEKGLTFNVDIKKGEAPKVEVPKVDAPKVEAPKVDTPKAEAPKVDTPKAETPKAETPKVYTLEDLKAFNPETAEYPEIKALVLGFNLDSASNKKVDLLAAIEAYKLAINTEVKE